MIKSLQYVVDFFFFFFNTLEHLTLQEASKGFWVHPDTASG